MWFDDGIENEIIKISLFSLLFKIEIYFLYSIKIQLWENPIYFLTEEEEEEWKMRFKNRILLKTLYNTFKKYESIKKQSK